ncbi:MAG: SOS response-associated peptidase [Alphaproteobacteria bacterium]|nr:SOS response-associated peptidase [Alphaproteobacteria bacterium]
MCGRYMVTSPPEAMRRLFGVQGVLPNFPPLYNVAPTQDVPVVFVAPEGRLHAAGEHRRLALMRWGLVPADSDADKNGKPRPGKPPIINARSATVAVAAPFKRAFRSRRCLIPANGYFEWDKATKAPHLYRPSNQGLFAFAGIWAEWRDPNRPDAPLLRSCAILTTGASTLVAPLHDCMPVILAPEAWVAWLGEAKADHAALQALLRPGGDEGFTDTIVSKRVNSHVNDDPACIEPAPSGESEAQLPRDRLL